MGRKAIARNPNNEPAHMTPRLWNMPVAKRAEQKSAKHIWRQANSSYIWHLGDDLIDSI